ncbi:MAG: endonuclease domain-containing protein [Trebonia sp.]
MRTATRTTTDGPPGHRSFTERHGLVRYARGLGASYPREGPCEVGICRAYGMEVEAGRLVFDHCHAHGWVRGLVCVPCNNRLMHVETGLGPPLPEWQLPALAAHLMKCPECREQSG